MIKEKTINILGKDVRMRYCAAAEKGFEEISGKDFNIFSPKTGRDENGNAIIIEPSTATPSDFLILGLACIVAAYSRTNEEPPITSDDILYEITREERDSIVIATSQLFADWYNVTKVVADVLAKEAEDISEDEVEKNA